MKDIQGGLSQYEWGHMSTAAGYRPGLYILGFLFILSPTLGTGFVALQGDDMSNNMMDVHKGTMKNQTTHCRSGMNLTGRAYSHTTSASSIRSWTRATSTET